MEIIYNVTTIVCKTQKSSTFLSLAYKHHPHYFKNWATGDLVTCCRSHGRPQWLAWTAARSQKGQTWNQRLQFVYPKISDTNVQTWEKGLRIIQQSKLDYRLYRHVTTIYGTAITNIHIPHLHTMQTVVKVC